MTLAEALALQKQIIEEIHKELGCPFLFAAQMYTRHTDYVADAQLDELTPKEIAQGIIRRDEEGPDHIP